MYFSRFSDEGFVVPLSSQERHPQWTLPSLQALQGRFHHPFPSIFTSRFSPSNTRTVITLVSTLFAISTDETKAEDGDQQLGMSLHVCPSLLALFDADR